MRPLILCLLLLLPAFVQADTNTNADVPITLPPAEDATTNKAAAAPAVDPARVQAYQNGRALRDAGELAKQGKTDDAIAKLTTLLQTDPRNISAYVLRGQLYISKKIYDKAANDFQAAHLIDPKNLIINFDIAEAKFVQKDYDGAKAAFLEIQAAKNSDLADLAKYKAFLCDLAANHNDAAQKEYNDFNNAGEFASYYYANVAWSLFHKNIEDGRGWLASASRIYSAQKNRLYAKSLFDLGYLPLPPPPAQH